MIVYIDTEHPSLAREDAELARRAEQATRRACERLAEIGGRPCQRVALATLRETGALAGASALVVGGHHSAYERYDDALLAPLDTLLRAPPAPTLAICAGLHRLALARGGAIAPLDPQARSAATPHPCESAPETSHMERGFHAVARCAASPLLARATLCVYQLHAWQVSAVPQGFEVIATSARCAVQAIAARAGPPLYGVQFHPERYDDAHPDGAALLAAFLRL